MAVSLVVYIAVYLALGAASVMKFTNVTIISVLLFIILPIFQAFLKNTYFMDL
ncbi:hypothetical protein [Methanobrevibacter sp.]|uniref:hypothetical protein n=1 Tax=Methanobrevibacter sp. TaxID=66852 RepID=UPI00388DBB57